MNGVDEFDEDILVGGSGKIGFVVGAAVSVRNTHNFLIKFKLAVCELATSVRFEESSYDDSSSVHL